MTKLLNNINMKSLVVIGRVIYGASFILLGIRHFIRTEKLTDLVPPYFPAPKIWVYITGVAMIAAAISIIINYKARIPSLLLALMLGLFVVLIHLQESSKMVPLTYIIFISGALIIAGMSKK